MELQRELLDKYREAIAYQAEQCDNGKSGLLDTFLQMRNSKRLLTDTINLIDTWIEDNMDEIIFEGDKHREGYKGVVISLRSGSRRFDFKGIPEWMEAETAKKAIEAKYKAMFEAKQKGAVHANVSEDGEELPLPDISYGKSSINYKVLK